MDERSQHGYPTHPQHAASEHGLAHPQAAAPSPWPTYAPPRPDAPIAGHAPYPGPGMQSPAPAQHPQQHAQPGQHAQPHAQQYPSMQQFQYAGNGYVLPGASEAHGAPMSAHGGTIGMAPQHGTPQHVAHGAAMPAQPQPPMYGHAAPQQYAQPQATPQYAQPQAYAQPVAHGGAAPMMLDANGQPQAWAFPTPNGLQLVQPGSTAMAPGSTMHRGMPGAPTARRMRWETIVPALAVVCLVAAIGVFMHDFEKITGRDVTDTSAKSAETTKQVDTTADAPAPGPDAAKTVKDATALFEQGKFDQAANLLHPILDGADPDPAAVALHDKVDAAAARNTALLKRLAGERSAKRWTAVIGTIGQIEQLRPLDRQLVSLRTRARAAVQQAKAKAAAERAAKARANSGPSTNGGGGSAHTQHSGHNPPAAGGNAGANSNVRPPANSPKAPTVPKPPTGVPNPTGGTNPAGVVGGGQAAETMCDVSRAPRHNGEDHGTAC